MIIMLIMLINKKKLKEIEREYSELKEKVNLLIETVSLFDRNFTELHQALFAEEQELSEEEQKEIEKQAQEQLEQMQILIKNSFKESLNDLLSNEENQKELVNFVSQIIAAAKNQAEIMPQQAMIENFKNKDGEIDLAAIIANLLYSKFTGSKSVEEKIQNISQNW